MTTLKEIVLMAYIHKAKIQAVIAICAKTFKISKMRRNRYMGKTKYPFYFLFQFSIESYFIKFIIKLDAILHSLILDQGQTLLKLLIISSDLDITPSYIRLTLMRSKCPINAHTKPLEVSLPNLKKFKFKASIKSCQNLLGFENVFHIQFRPISLLLYTKCVISDQVEYIVAPATEFSLDLLKIDPGLALALMHVLLFIV